MSLLVNQTYEQGFQQGFNQGMQIASQRFDIFIQVLALTFAAKIILQFPPIRNKLEEKTKHTWIINQIEIGADVLAFFIVAVIYWSLSGNPILN